MCGWTARPARSPTARELVKTKAGEWRTAFIDDEPGQGISARSQVGAQHPRPKAVLEHKTQDQTIAKRVAARAGPAVREFSYWRAALSSAPSSSAVRRRSRAGGSFGIRICATGLPCGNEIPHSFVAVLKTRDNSDKSWRAVCEFTFSSRSSRYCARTDEVTAESLSCPKSSLMRLIWDLTWR